MTVQYSIQKMVSDGTLSTIALGIQYLQRNDIYMRVAGEETPQSGAPSGYTWSFLDNTTLKILPVVPNGVEVVVYRRTDVDAMYNIYSQNAQFDEATIDENNQQLLYIAQEYLEQGIPGAGVDTIEFLRDDGINTYYRIKRTDGSYSEEFTVPSASSSTKVLAREALRRSYAEAGYNLIGDFSNTGLVVNSATDVVLWEPTGIAYSYSGTLPHTIGAGETPVGNPSWVPVAASSLRADIQVADYAALRAYTGTLKSVYVTGVIGTATPEGIAGSFALDSADSTSADNGGTVIVDALGHRWKRQYSGIPSVLWWGAKPDWNGVTGTDNTAALQAAHNAHAVLFYPYGSYKTGSITLTKFGATLVGPGELYGMAELVYTGSGTLFTCTAGVSYVQFKSGMYLHGIPAVSTDYYNTGSIAVDITAGNTSLIFDGSWVNSFEILFNSNYNNFYNRFTNNRLERFRIGLNKFSSNNLHIEKNRISRFNTAILANGGNGPLVIDKNAFEVFNGPIASMSGVEQGEIVFTNNYVELYDSVDLPTNFPPSDAPNTGKFGGNILFTGPIGSFKQSGNDLQIGGCRRIMSASLHVDVIESVGNNIHILTTGNNLDYMWVAPSVGSININDRLGITQGTGGYSRTYVGLALAQLDPNRPYFFYDCIARKSFRAAAETSALALLNGWTNPDANHGVARVHKKDGEVRLSGVVDGAARTAATVFNIPAAYRPDEIGTTRAYANFSCFSVYGGGTVVRMRYLYASGDLRMEGSPASVEAVSLEGITIPTRT